MTAAGRIFLQILIIREPNQPVQCGAHVGRTRAIKRDELLKHVAARLYAEGKIATEQEFSDEDLRRTKEELIEQYHPICFGPKGYYYAASLAEAEEGAKQHDDLASDHHHKAKCLRESGVRVYGSQTEIPI